jgi:DNA-directed RNA polymerase subunit RPC12/RpoP
MEKQDIERIAQLVSYAIFLLVYSNFKRMGNYILRNDPDNLVLPLYFQKHVKVGWKIIYDIVFLFCLTVLLIIEVQSDLSLANAPFAALFSLAIAFYGVGIIARLMKKNIWKYDQKPTSNDRASAIGSKVWVCTNCNEVNGFAVSVCGKCGHEHSSLALHSAKPVDSFLPSVVACPNCGEELELDQSERTERKFTCPSCKSFIQLKSSVA